MRNENIIEILKGWRKKNNLSRREAAEVLGVALSTYTGYENGTSKIYPVREQLIKGALYDHKWS